MQTVVYSDDYKPIHLVFSEMDRFYTLTSEKEYKQAGLIKDSFDKSFSDLLSLFRKYGHIKYGFKLVDRKYKPLDIPKYNKNNIILAFSGGKDSVAAALYYKDAGYNVHLYHLRGLNTAYPDEYKQAEKLAHELQLPIHISTIKVKGKHSWEVTHPCKCMLLYNQMIQYGIKNNIGYSLAVGHFLDEYLDEAAFERETSDTIDFDEAYYQIIRTIIPDFEIKRCLNASADTFDVLLEHPKLLELSQSCMCQQRFREYNKKKIEEKYSIQLMPNRCGGCSKCSREYIYYADKGLLEFNEIYYLKCLQNLVDFQKKMWSTEKPVETIKELFKKYIGYSHKQSKIYEKLLKLSIKDGKIK